MTTKFQVPKTRVCRFDICERYQILSVGKYIHTYLAQTPEIGQGQGRFLSCGARKQEHT